MTSACRHRYADEHGDSRSDPRRDIRVGDRSRNNTAELLGMHYAAGRLTNEELEARLADTWKAVTRHELDAVVSDLPNVGRSAARNRRARAAVRIHTTAYVIVTSLLVVIWLLTGAGYFWPIWPAVGCGTGLAAHAAATRSLSRPPRQ